MRKHLPKVQEIPLKYPEFAASHNAVTVPCDNAIHR
jgi:hypothetical protein